VKRKLALVAMIFLIAGCDNRPAASAAWGVPARAIRFASYNTFKSNRGRDKVLADIRSKSPDIVFLQEVPTIDLPEETARQLGMHHAFRKHTNYPSEGVAIYSRWPLSNVAPVIDKNGRACALFADVEVDGRTFTVASVHLEATTKRTVGNLLWSDRVRGEEIALIRKTWADRGSHPIIIAGDFNQIPVGGNYSAMTSNLKDALNWIGKPSPTLGEGNVRLRVDYFLCSKEWKPLDGGVVVSDASDHDMIWLEAKAMAAGAAATQPATSHASSAPRQSTRAVAGSLPAAPAAGRSG
jgi:endonuclease/exonuclease/phosphatase family metal-dependent hydrolase